MAVELAALTFDAADPVVLARFWGGVLGREVREDAFGVRLVPAAEVDVPLRFHRAPAAKWGPNQVHFDLTSTSLADQQETVALALELGGRHHDVGQRPEEGHVVLADPEDNEFCVIEPGNNFLANTARIGALAGDGTQAVGYFWSRALGWPLVWDQDEETAIQSPAGGTKISWGGPPVAPKLGKNRLHLDLRVCADSTHADELARLISLGANRIDVGQGFVPWVVLADPGGNEFCLHPPR